MNLGIRSSISDSVYSALYSYNKGSSYEICCGSKSSLVPYPCLLFPSCREGLARCKLGYSQTVEQLIVLEDTKNPMYHWPVSRCATASRYSTGLQTAKAQNENHLSCRRFSSSRSEVKVLFGKKHTSVHE